MCKVLYDAVHMAGPNASSSAKPHGNSGLEAAPDVGAGLQADAPAVLFCGDMNCDANDGTSGERQPA